MFVKQCLEELLGELTDAISLLNRFKNSDFGSLSESPDKESSSLKLLGKFPVTFIEVFIEVFRITKSNFQALKIKL